ncbi:type I-E CRISPR-associated protein Cas7/Cse4/CasC [Streptomyces sp. AA1529]|uniref:type I-E CRISPR-associated protein Cas7/Cse4/CasC n=1 Tax=Streptomyces sp. AA1529 TaxID=1203257 RepID=UPI003D762360
MPPRLYLDLHILQSVPPSNLNRDDAGTPKHALFGGARRARVSSQAWKRATRKAWAQEQPKADHATRTKRIASLLADTLKESEDLSDTDAARLATALLAPLGITPSQKKEEETAYLLFFGHRQLQGIAQLVQGRGQELLQFDDADLAKELADLKVDEELMQSHPLEVALFGRMVANRAALNVDASVQVAHALSTHAVETEFDYYTAVDDENERGETGAGMIGTVEFNSSTLYRYATVNIPYLHSNLGGTSDTQQATAEAVEGFTTAFVKSMPTGHQNSFAHRTLPHLVIAALRTDQPINLVSAFEKPLHTRTGAAEKSAELLAGEAQAIKETWGSAPERVFATYSPMSEGPTRALTEVFGASTSFPQLTSGLRESTLTWLRDGTL